jgi:hypothetical protein
MSVLSRPAKRTNHIYQEAFKLNYNQNKKIAQITSQTLIIGVDIAKFKHVARAQDFRDWSLELLVTLKIHKPISSCFSAGSRS